jgi:hypothetical protein
VKSFFRFYNFVFFFFFFLRLRKRSWWVEWGESISWILGPESFADTRAASRDGWRMARSLVGQTMSRQVTIRVFIYF